MAETRNTIRWDSVGADKVKRDYAEVQAADTKTADGFKRTGGAASQAGDGINRLGTSARDYASHANVAATSTNTLNVGLAALARYASATALLELGRRTVLAADSFKGLQNQLRVAGFESDALASATDRLFQISNRTKTSIEANATLYGRLSSVQGELGASSEQLFVFTEAVGNALKINNTEAAAAQGALLQLSQAMGGAKIQAQEFNSLIDGMRPLLQAAAKYIDGAGGSVSKLQQMVRDGELSNREFFEGVLKGAKDLAEQSALSQTRVGQSLTELSNKFIQAAGESEAFTAASNGAAAAIETLAGRMGELARVADAAIEPLATVAGWFGSMATDADSFIAKTPALLAAFKELEQFNKRMFTPGGLVRFTYEYLTSKGPTAAPPNLSDMPAGETPNYLSGYNQDRPSYKGPKNRYGVIPTDAEIKAAVKAQEDWQQKVAEGWATVYEKVGEASEDFYAQVAKDAKEAGEAEDKAYRDRQEAISGVIDDLTLETELLGLSNAERERRVGLLKLEKANASADQIARFNAAFDAKNVAEAAKKAADEVEAIWTNAAQGVSDAWSDFLFDAFDKGKFKFGDFAKSLKSIWARTIADMIALSTQQSIVAPLFASMFGVAMPGASGAAGTQSAFASLNSGAIGRFLFGGSSAAGAAPGSAEYMKDIYQGSGVGGVMGTKIGSSTLGGTLGAGMKGYAIGQMVGSGQGGAVGGMIGQQFGPVGQIIGSVIGGIIGGLFKSTPKSVSSYGTSGVSDSMAAGGLDVKIGKDMANGVVRALRTFSEQLATSIESDSFLGIVGQRGKKFFYQAQQTDLKVAGKSKYGAVKFDSAEEAIAAAIEAAINSGVVRGLTDADKKLMRAAGSVEQAMQDVISSHDFKRELDFQFTGLSNPLSEAQARLEFEYQQQLILADKYEADKTKLEAVYAQKRLDLVEQYNQQQNAALEQSLGGLKDYLFDLTGGSSSPLSPTNRLNLAQARYNDIRKKALAGDKDAIGQLQGASQDFLSASRSVFGSTAGFQSSYQNVVATLSQITGSVNPLGAANQNVAAAVNDNSRIQATYAERAASQRAEQTALLQSIDAKLSASASAAQRGSPAPSQNGVVQVGSVDMAAIQQAVAGIRW